MELSTCNWMEVNESHHQAYTYFFEYTWLVCKMDLKRIKQHMNKMILKVPEITF